jgi:hypothetical protein
MRDYPGKFSKGLMKRKNLPLYQEGGEVEEPDVMAEVQESNELQSVLPPSKFPDEVPPGQQEEYLGEVMHRGKLMEDYREGVAMPPDPSNQAYREQMTRKKRR